MNFEQTTIAINKTVVATNDATIKELGGQQKIITRIINEGSGFLQQSADEAAGTVVKKGFINIMHKQQLLVIEVEGVLRV